MSVTGLVENVGEGQNAALSSLQAIYPFPFPQYFQKTCNLQQRRNQRTDSPESRLEGNGLEVFTLFCSNQDTK